MKVLAILDDHPEATARSAALLRLAVELVAWRPDLHVTVLLDGQALRLAVGDLPPHTGRYCATHLLTSVTAGGGSVVASAVGLAIRGIPRTALRPGVGTLMPLEIEDLTEASDRVLRF